jgi:hypothetical protein
VDQGADPSGVLRVKWRRLVLMVEDIPIPALGHHVKKGEEVSCGCRDVEHEWRVGEQMDLQVQDGADVAHSLIGFVYEIANLVDARLGVLSGRSPDQSAGAARRNGHLAGRDRAQHDIGRRRRARDLDRAGDRSRQSCPEASPEPAQVSPVEPRRAVGPGRAASPGPAEVWTGGGAQAALLIRAGRGRRGPGRASHPRRTGSPGR